ncbi:MAG TPA: alcohol dehydrogenase catalytic domain-containing protein, partial [Nitrospiraceae bacterium]|nr:alcohol dehydrogenase catalytic domain-containing protein [Nitrospiraceae bacterium]
MRALVKAAARPGLTLQQVPDPRPGEGEVLVRVLATSLCGTDAHIYRWDDWAQSRVHPPRIIGHELCGEVVELGPGVTTVSVGDYVAAESHLTCGICFQCRTGQAHVCRQYRILGIDLDGSFAESIVLPERVLWRTSRNVPPELACLQEPLGNAVYAALVEELAGRSVLITGCGPSGLFAAGVARVSGAAMIIGTDVGEYRMGLAKRMGVDHLLNAKQDSPESMAGAIRDLTHGEGVDAVLEMSGAPGALHLAFQTV